MVNNPEVIKKIKKGGVGVLPTDTVYGIACSASNPEAVQRLYALKSRENKPGTVVAATIEQLVDLGIPRRYLTAVEQYWPGAVSVVIPVGAALEYLHLGKHSLALRIPADETFRTVLQETGPLLTSSANAPGSEPANTIEQAKDYFNDNVDFYVDGGDLTGRESSTIIRIIDDAVEILRQGAVKISDSGEIDRS